ncbi:MAG: DUF3592 domain-containing protein [Planctomycetia bacterium]
MHWSATVRGRLGLLAAGLGVVPIIASIVTVAAGYASQSWPTAPGVVRASAVLLKADGYHLDFLYDYAVDGRRYESRRVSFGERRVASSDDVFEGVLDAYPVGVAVDVYYKPGEPAVAVLEPGVRLLAFWGLPFGALVVAFGLWTAYSAWRPPSGPPPS